MIYLNCSGLIEIGKGFDNRTKYAPKAKFSSNMADFDFYEINSALLKLYQNTGIETADLIEFFKNCLINSIKVERVSIHYMDGDYVEDSDSEYEATFSYIKNFPFVLRGNFRDVRKFVHGVLLYCNTYDWEYDEVPVKDRNPINSLIVYGYNNNLGRLLNEIMKCLKPFINNSSKNKEELLEDMPWALDPFRNMESRLIERPY